MANSNDIKYSPLFSSIRYTNVDCINHLHGSMEIILVTEGTLSIYLNGCELQVSAGSALFASPFMLHRFSSKEANRSHIIVFSGELIPYFSKFLDSNKVAFPIFTPSKESMALIDKILPDENNHPDFIKAQAVLSCLCCDICACCDFAPRKSYDSEPLSLAIDYIHSHFTEEITLEIVAKEVGIHPVTLSRNFTSNLHANFNSYLNLLRCSNAANLLQSSNNTASEIAFASGFGSIRSFNRSFLKVFGVTPTEYREKPFI